MIKFLKLITGEDIVGRVNKLDNSYRIECPVKIVTEPFTEGKPRSRVEPYVPHLKEPVILLSEDKIFLMGEPSMELAGYYLSTYLTPWDAIMQNEEAVNEG